MIILALINLTKIGKTSPINYIFLLIFTICMSYVVGFLGLKFSEYVILAAGIVFLLVLSLYILSLIIPNDISIIGGVVCILITLLVSIGLSYLYLNKN